MDIRAYFHAVMELSHGLVLVVDPEGRVVHADSRWEALLGRALAPGDDWWAWVDAADQELGRRMVAQVAETVVSWGAWVRGAAGPRYVEWRARALRPGELVLLVGVDVTLHMERQQRLEEEQAQLRAAHSTLACLHALALLGADPQQDLSAILAQAPELVHQAVSRPEIAVAIRLDGRVVAQVGRVEEPADHVAPLVVQGRRRGSLRLGGPVATLDRAMADQVAVQLASLVAKREAQGARARLEAQVRRADRLAKMGQLAAGLAHELSEPLANILGFAQLVAAEPGLPQSVVHDMARIEAAVLHCREVIQKLLIFGRQVPLRREPVALGGVLQEVARLLEPSAARRQVQVEWAADSDAVVLGDAAQLQQAVLNVAVNGIHAMERGGVLRLVAQRADGNVYVAVEDTGHGMSPEVMRQIFQPFFTTKGPDGGTGLGLAVVHGIVSAHGGVIDVRSALGQGTCVEIVLPQME